eukprot:scaffold880_cov384-Prasinococcus_capsulatus_cf.AAC.11
MPPPATTPRRAPACCHGLCPCGTLRRVLSPRGCAAHAVAAGGADRDSRRPLRPGRLSRGHWRTPRLGTSSAERASLWVRLAVAEEARDPVLQYRYSTGLLVQDTSSVVEHPHATRQAQTPRVRSLNRAQRRCAYTHLCNNGFVQRSDGTKLCDARAEDAARRDDARYPSARKRSRQGGRRRTDPILLRCMPGLVRVGDTMLVPSMDSNPLCEWRVGGAGTEDERSLRDMQTYMELYVDGAIPDALCLVATLDVIPKPDVGDENGPNGMTPYTCAAVSVGAGRQWASEPVTTLVAGRLCRALLRREGARKLRAQAAAGAAGGARRALRLPFQYGGASVVSSVGDTLFGLLEVELLAGGGGAGCAGQGHVYEHEDLLARAGWRHGGVQFVRSRPLCDGGGRERIRAEDAYGCIKKGADVQGTALHRLARDSSASHACYTARPAWACSIQVSHIRWTERPPDYRCRPTSRAEAGYGESSGVKAQRLARLRWPGSALPVEIVERRCERRWHCPRGPIYRARLRPAQSSLATLGSPPTRRVQRHTERTSQ